jgi:hypothetical protein
MLRNKKTYRANFLTVVCVLLGWNQYVVGVYPIQPYPVFYDLTFFLREAPLDPESEVKYEVRLYLKNVQMNGQSIGWEISEIEIFRPGDGKIWREYAPVVNTADGLWWVEHSDARHPQAAEFSTTPVLTGTAASVYDMTDSLVYFFVGTPFEPEPGTPSPYGLNTTSTSYIFQTQTDPVVVDEEDDEPSETSGDYNTHR